MKAKLGILKLTVILCSAFTTTAVFGQVITWIGPDAALPGGANFGHSTNWSPAELPLSGTICTFDGTVPGNLVVYSRDGIDGCVFCLIGSFGSSGVSIDLTPNQTGSVNLICYTGVTSSVNMGFNALRVQTGAGPLILGDTSTRQLPIVLRPGPGTHLFINNSTNPVIIHPNVEFLNGGGSPGHVINFQGTGDFHITNALRWNNNAPAGALQWDSTGTTIWAAGGVNNKFNSPLGNVIVNAGKVIVEGSGLLPLSPSSTTVSNGTLIVNGSNPDSSVLVYGGTLGGTGVLGLVTIQSGGTLAPGISIGTLTVSSNLNIAGNMVFEVNKSLAQSNDFVIVNGTLTNSGAGTLTVSKLPVLGWPLAYGDKFTLFSKPVQNGSALTVTGAGVNWINNLEVDGSIIVSPPILNFTNLGGTNLQFSWTGDYGLQWQTNSVHVGLSNNWANYPGGGPGPVTVPLDVTKGAVFFRLVPVPVLFHHQGKP